MDYAGLGASLLAQAATLLPAWFPAGYFDGREFKIGNLAGDAGKSLSVNTVTGTWADFAADNVKGADLIDLYAAIHHVSLKQAYQELQGRYGGVALAVAPKSRPERAPARPNGHAAGFTGQHSKHGLPSHIHAYKDGAGELLFYVCRYATKEGKTYAPWTWAGNRWVTRAWPTPRPLYGLELLASRPSQRVLIVEGERCADEARQLLAEDFVTICWAGGAMAVSTADFRPLAGRTVTIWPDADEPGRRAAAAVQQALAGITTAEILSTPMDKPGYDVADLIADGADREALLSYIAAQCKPTLQAHVVSQPRAKARQVRREALPDFRDERSAWEHFDLPLGPGGRPIPNMDVAERVIRAHPDTRDALWYDEFADCVMLGERQFNEEKDAPDLLIVLQRQICLAKMATGPLLEAVGCYARSRARHPVREWLDGLAAWDGEGRLSAMMALGFGTIQDDYHASIGSNLLSAMIARVLDPGCKHDYMPVLEGAEGIGKSTALSVLGDPWYSQNHERMVGKDFLQNLPGVWVVEINELESFSGASQEKIKGIISDPNDRYRQSYGRRAHPHPRQCVFIGTTNASDWNHSTTGARRFWPAKCGKIDLDWLRENRDQLFVEALNRYQTGQSWWNVPNDRALEEQELRHVDDPWKVALSRALESRTQFTIDDAWFTLSIELPDRDLKTARRIGSILRQLGWSPKTERINKYDTQKVYRPDVT